MRLAVVAALSALALALGVTRAPRQRAVRRRGAQAGARRAAATTAASRSACSPRRSATSSRSWAASTRPTSTRATGSRAAPTPSTSARTSASRPACQFTQFHSAVTDSYERRYPQIQVINSPTERRNLYFGHLIWTFAYGKLRWMGDGISRFDFNLAFGGGRDRRQTSRGATGERGPRAQALLRQVVRPAVRRARPRAAARCSWATSTSSTT